VPLLTQQIRLDIEIEKEEEQEEERGSQGRK